MEIVEDEGAWVASVPDLPGCTSFGTTVTGAVDNVKEAKELWIRSQFASGGEIPEPTETDDFSGKFVLRIPKLLHRSLAYQAKKQGVSLNHYASHLLSERHPLTVIQSMLSAHLNFWEHCQNTWLYHRETSKHKAVSMGTTLPGNVSLVVHLSKPADKRTIRVPQTIKEQYQLNYASNR